MEERACASYTHIKNRKENLAFLASVFDPEMLRIRAKEREQDKVNAAHSPVCEQHADAGNTLGLVVCVCVCVRNLCNNHGLEVTILNHLSHLV